MVFGLPAIGEGTWGQKILDSINAVKATADAAQPSATLDAGVTAVDSNAASALRVQQDARHAATYVSSFIAKGAGIDPTGTTDSTAAIQALIDAAHAAGGGEVVLPPGTYLCSNLNVGESAGSAVKLRGQGTVGHWSNPAWLSATILKQIPSSSSPLMAMLRGAEIENIVLNGNAHATQTALYIADGFEARLRHVRIINNATTGLDIFQANNIQFQDVYVNACGSATAAAVRIRSYATTTVSNGLMLHGLTIEGSANTALDIATGADVAVGDTDYAEFIQVFGLHAEGSNSGPLVTVGNVRSVDLIAPFLVGGPGPLVKYDEQVDTLGINGGLKVIGGALIGAAGANTPANLIDLNRGDGFSIDGGTVLDNASGAAITVRSTFGGTVNVGQAFQTRLGSLVADARTTGQITRSVPADTAWRVPTLVGAWVNSGIAGYTVAGYRIDTAGVVHLKGLVDSGTGVIFTLPAGYRPAKNLQLPICGSAAAYASVEVASDGSVIKATGTNPLDLSSISFLAEQ